MTHFPMRVLVSVALGSTALMAAPAHPQRAARQQQADIIVVDQANNPVTDLSVADFIVREDGVAREVTAVTPGGPPSPIELLIDTSQAVEPSVLDLRRGLTGFVTKMGEAEGSVLIGLRTFGERPTKVSDPATPALVQVGIDRLFHRTGTGAYMLEAIVEAANELAKAGVNRPALVAFDVEAGPEFSQPDRTRVADALKRAGATLWVVELQSRGGIVNTVENRERAAVVGDGTVESGGLSLPVLSSQAIPQAFDRLTTLFSSRLRISYGRPDELIPPERLEITTRREGLRVLAPRWAAGQ